MFTVYSARRVAWCLLAAGFVLSSAVDAKELKLKAVKLKAQTVEAPVEIPAVVAAPARGTGVVAAADIGDGVPPPTEFRFDLFANHLDSQLAPHTVGYEYAIYQGLTLRASGAGGFATLSPAVPMTPDRKISTASTSKTITAAAVLRAIEIMNARGEDVSLDSPITAFLPSAWKPGPHVNEITLRDLLAHTSGYRLPYNLFEELRIQIVIGVKEANWAARNGGYYSNTNYTLLRIIIPYMVHGRAAMEQRPEVSLDDPTLKVETKSGPAKNKSDAQIDLAQTLEERTARAYVKFVKDEVLAKVGLGGGKVGIAPTGPGQDMRYYNFDDPTEMFPGYSYDYALLNGGASLWLLSAKEYGTFITGLRAGRILKAKDFNAMTAGSLGMFDGSSDAGPTWWHNGAGTHGRAGFRGAWMMFPGNITAVVFYNSVDWVGGTTGEALPPPQNILRDAFNEARKLQTLAVEP